MGIFSKAEKTASKPSRHDLQKALFIMGFAVAMADGEADESEIIKMLAVAARMPLFFNNTTEQDTAVMHEAGTLYDEGARPAVEWAIDVIQYENWRVVAVCFMCEIVMADGVIDKGEMDVLNDICDALKIDIDVAQAIFNTFQVYYQRYEG